MGTCGQEGCSVPEDCSRNEFGKFKHVELHLFLDPDTGKYYRWSPTRDGWEEKRWDDKYDH